MSVIAYLAAIGLHAVDFVPAGGSCIGSNGCCLLLHPSHHPVKDAKFAVRGAAACCAAAAAYAAAVATTDCAAAECAAAIADGVTAAVIEAWRRQSRRRAAAAAAAAAHPAQRCPLPGLARHCGIRACCLPALRCLFGGCCVVDGSSLGSLLAAARGRLPPLQRLGAVTAILHPPPRLGGRRACSMAPNLAPDLGCLRILGDVGLPRGSCRERRWRQAAARMVALAADAAAAANGAPGAAAGRQDAG